MAVSVVMPQLGESVVEGTITKWLVKEGDPVTKDQPVVSIATDKAESEVPAPATGVLKKILVAEGQTVPVNTQIAVIEPGAVAAAPTPPTQPTPPSEEGRKTEAEETYTGPTSPAVRKLALEYGVDLSKVKGTGENGRITKQDVLHAAAIQRAAVSAPSSVPSEAVKVASAAGAPPSAPTPSVVPSEAVKVTAAGAAPPSVSARVETPAEVRTPTSWGAFRVPPYVPQPGDEIVPFTRRRRIIADHMVYSKHVAPHVMTIAEIDMYRVHRLREAHKAALKAEGINLTYLAFIAAATVRALRENPVMNARVLDDAYVKLKHINLGIAVETPEGLVVPVIRDADNLTVRGLARAIDEMATKARTGKITADDLTGATFTISNPGIKGNFVGAAIISQPNVGILRTGEIVKRPVVVEVEGQDTIAIHPVMFAALSYDHRIVDGVAANNFLYRITELLEAGQFEL